MSPVYYLHFCQFVGQKSLLISIILSGLLLNAQSPQKRALIISINDYLNDRDNADAAPMSRIGATDLQFANNDAASFREWIMSVGGWGLDSSQVEWLRDSTAASGNIDEGLARLYVNDYTVRLNGREAST